MMLRRRLGIALGIIRAFKDWPTMFVLMRKLGPGLGTVRTRDGITFRLRETRWDARILREMYVDQPYTFALGPMPVVVDAGAFIGDFSLLAAVRWGATVHAYEPIKEQHERLLDHIALNGMEDRVIAHYEAVGAETGTLNLNVTTSGQDVHASSAWYGEAEHRSVPCTALNDIVAGLGTVDLLKIDVEGGEYEIIARTSIDGLRNVRNIVAEWHRIDGYEPLLEAMVGKLTRAGFAVSFEADDILRATR